MPRKRAIVKRELPGDPMFGNPMVTRFLNSLLNAGKRSKAERNVSLTCLKTSP